MNVNHGIREDDIENYQPTLDLGQYGDPNDHTKLNADLASKVNKVNESVEIYEPEEIDFLETKVVTGQMLMGDQCHCRDGFNNTLSSDMRFINSSSHKITICFRDGTVAELPRQTKGPYIESLIITHSRYNTNSEINTISGNECYQTKNIRSLLARSSGVSFYWEEVIPVSDIIDARGGVYIKAADVVAIESENISNVVNHPFSEQRIHNSYLTPGGDFCAETDINIAVRIVDNNNSHSRMYAVINKTIMFLKPKKSFTMPDGVYITGLSGLSTATSNCIRNDIRYSFEDAAKGQTPIPIFKSLDEAKEYVRICSGQYKDAELKEKAMNREHELTILALKRQVEKLTGETNLDKARINKSKLTEDVELERLKQETEILQLRSDIERMRAEAQIVENRLREENRLALEAMRVAADEAVLLSERKAFDDKLKFEREKMKFDEEVKNQQEKAERDRIKAEEDLKANREKSEQATKASYQKMAIEALKLIGVALTVGFTVWKLMKQ